VTDIVVTTAEQPGNWPAEPSAEPAPVAAAASSPLASLRARRAKAQERLYKDLKVPRWDDDGGPAIYVRYKPLSPGKMATAVERRRRDKAKDQDWATKANADALIGSCMGVFTEIDGAQYSLREGDRNGSWTTFDPDLGAALGVESQNAVDVVRALYLTDGDLINAAATLTTWSGLVGPQADEDYLGE